MIFNDSRTNAFAVTAKRKIDNKVTEETGYFISSLDANDPQRLERAVGAGAQGLIENNLYSAIAPASPKAPTVGALPPASVQSRVLDIAFDEDSNRTRKGHSAANLAVSGILP